MFTERREGEADATGSVEPDGAHEGGSSPARSRFAFTGKRRIPSDTDKDTGEKRGRYPDRFHSGRGHICR